MIFLSHEDVPSLLERVDAEMASAQEDLEYAEVIAQASGLTVRSSVLDASFPNNNSNNNNNHNNTAIGGTGSTWKIAGMMSSMVNAASTITTITTTTTTTTTTTGESMDQALHHHHQEAARALLQARHEYNPMRGTLLAYPLVLSTTGGYCNTDHIVPMHPTKKDGTIDQLAEYKRQLKRRIRQLQPEERGMDRWDLPRIPGGRRRRIKRDADANCAPPEPPQTGYVIYVSQMTTKVRHDHPNRPHNQIAAIRWISSRWNTLPQKEREHYVQLAKDARLEYEERLMEYRATGSWSPYTTFTRLSWNKNGVDCRRIGLSNERSTGSNGPWVRIPYEKKNALEREIETYEQVIFPPRPADYEEGHVKKLEESKQKRRVKRQTTR